MGINPWAVVAAAVASMAVGMVWYGPVFGKLWRRLAGLSEADMRSMPLSPMPAMGLGLVLTLVMAYVVARFSEIWPVLSAGDALRLGFLAWLGFLMPVTAGAWLWEGKSPKLFVLNAAHRLVDISVIALIVGLWR